MLDQDLLRGHAETLIAAIADRPFARAVLHDGSNRPVAVIMLIDDPALAAKFAAMLPQIEARLGVELDDDPH